MSLSRTLEVPARFHMGFPIPDKSEGIVGGYHCWADYYVEGQGWTPVDISEADKAPEKTDYFFGNVTESRVEMMVGRDFELKGYDQGVINLFIYPLLEIEDELSKSFSKSFSYKNL
jgi:transglutaminase-like putative cysteine protease